MKDTFNIAPLGMKSAKTYVVDFASLPESSQNFITHYGLKQYLADAHASVNSKVYAEKVEDWELLTEAEQAERIKDDAEESVQARINVLINGETATRARAITSRTFEGLFNKAVAEYIARRVKGAKPSELLVQIQTHGLDRVIQVVEKAGVFKQKPWESVKDALTAQVEAQLAPTTEISLDSLNFGEE